MGTVFRSLWNSSSLSAITSALLHEHQDDGSMMGITRSGSYVALSRRAVFHCSPPIVTMALLAQESNSDQVVNGHRTAFVLARSAATGS